MAATPFDSLRDLDRWLTNGLVRTPASVGMPLDLYRKGESFGAHIDLPGVDPATIDVDVEDRTLTVRAERPARDEDGVQWRAHADDPRGGGGQAPQDRGGALQGGPAHYRGRAEGLNRSGTPRA